MAARLGVGPDDAPPTAVYCSITGFGVEGPHAARAGHDLNYLGWAGVLEDTAPGLPPLQPADLAAGALGAVAEILAALLERERTGRGPRLTISMTHGSHRLVAHRLGGDPLPRFLTGGLACYRIYETADGRYLTVGALEPKFFLRLCELIERPELARAPPRRRRAGGARGRARRRLREPAARRVARALRRRGRLRRPGRDARGGCDGLRPATALPSARVGQHTEGMAGRARLLLTAVALAPLPLLAAVAWNAEAEAARGLARAVVSVRDGDLYVGDRQVTSGGTDSDPDWSPDRRRIAFVRQDPGTALVEPLRDPPRRRRPPQRLTRGRAGGRDAGVARRRDACSPTRRARSRAAASTSGRSGSTAARRGAWPADRPSRSRPPSTAAEGDRSACSSRATSSR